ncbi:alpha/beta-hydrolase, partial [Glonium stellatum]
KYATIVRLQPSVHLKPSALKERFVMVQPGSMEIYNGILDIASIKPAPVSAILFPKPYNSEEYKDAKIILHFQGGAFVTATEPNNTGRFPMDIFARKMGAITLYARYRLAYTEDTRFPAALQDLVTFYRYFLNLGINPSNVIIFGDSAGSNLVIALLRYIKVSKGILPVPYGAMFSDPF